MCNQLDMLDLGSGFPLSKLELPVQEGRGYAISIVPQALSYRLDKGEVVMKGSNINVPQPPVSTSFPTAARIHRDYVTPPEYLPDKRRHQGMEGRHERRRNVHFMFKRVTGEKLVIVRPHVQHPYGAALICDPAIRASLPISGSSLTTSSAVFTKCI